MPASLRASAIGHRVSLTWSPSSDNVAVKGYRVYRDGALIGTASTSAYLDSSGTLRKQYRYTVAAYDAAGNASAQSAPVTVTTPTR